MERPIRIYVFACGQGDTILLSLRGKWVLIDCNLPKGVIRRRFFAKLKKLRINRLDLLCLTHPHHDHYHGMGEVVDYFTSNGRSLGKFCDSGVDPNQVIEIIKAANLVPESLRREHELLYDKLNVLMENKVIGYFLGNQDSQSPISGSGLELVPLGPESRLTRETALLAIEEGDWTSSLKNRLNRLSIVLGLKVGSGPGRKRFDALLAADTDADGFNGACEALRRYHKCRKPCEFDFVKVSHHGSLDSYHGSSVCALGKKHGRVAVVTCDGDDAKLPDRHVLRKFLESGWTVLPTTRRYVERDEEQNGRLADTPLTMVSETSSEDQLKSSISDDIEITWSERYGLKYKPLKAKVTEVELPNYGTAVVNERTKPKRAPKVELLPGS